ncbi:MAG: leucine-rich repeat domain-containing protein [bacterium]|nr:leucine-rich repeat domain-containing protein [bacterium]
MKEKGFTLIELLAVIVILAIIALIAVPIIIDIIEDSKKEALKRSAENYLKAVELAIAKENLNGEFNPNSCTITSGITKCGDKTLNVTVDGELPDSGEIMLSNGTIDKTSLTTLTYKSGTVAYDSNGKLTIESPKKELIAEGEIITQATNGVAINVDNQLVYYVPNGSTEAIVYGYRGERDYRDPGDMLFQMSGVLTSGNVEIASKVKINGETYPVKSVGSQAFSYNSDITSVTIPDSITSIGESAFQGCTNLNSIVIPNSVTSIGAYAFSGCTNLGSIVIPTSVTSIGNSAFMGIPWYISQQQLNNGLVIAGSILIDGKSATGDVVIPNNVTSIGSLAFALNSNITSVTIPSSVTSIGSGAFMNCNNLKTINIDKPEGSISGSPWSGSGCTINWAN